MKRKGNVILLHCGHVVHVKTFDAACPHCEADDTLDDTDDFGSGYRAGLCAQLDLDAASLTRLAKAWLLKSGHRDGCACQPCDCARKVLRL